MDIVDGLKLVARWWFATVPVLVTSVVAAIVMTSGIQPEYRAEGAVLFLAPSVQSTVLDDEGEPTTVNPLLVGSSGLATAAEVSTLAINNAEVAQILASEGLSPHFAVGTTSRSPILLIETTARSREMATATALRVTELIELDLELRQDAAGVQDEQRVTTSVVSLTAVGGGDYGSRTRIRIAIVGFGIGLAAGSAFLLDGLRRRREAGQARDTATLDTVDGDERNGSRARGHAAIDEDSIDAATIDETSIDAATVDEDSIDAATVAAAESDDLDGNVVRSVRVDASERRQTNGAKASDDRSDREDRSGAIAGRGRSDAG